MTLGDLYHIRISDLLSIYHIPSSLNCTIKRLVFNVHLLQDLKKIAYVFNYFKVLVTIVYVNAGAVSLV